MTPPLFVFVQIQILPVDAQVVDGHAPKEGCHIVSVEELKGKTWQQRVVDCVEQVASEESN